MHGYPFTWDKSRGTPAWMEEKLDRALASKEWHSQFHGAHVINEDAPPSDHSAIILCMTEKPPSPRQRFRFENTWVQEEDCRALVARSWNLVHTPDAHEGIHKCALDLEAWDQDRRKKFRSQLTNWRNIIRFLNNKGDKVSTGQLQAARHECWSKIEYMG